MIFPFTLIQDFANLKSALKRKEARRLIVDTLENISLYESISPDLKTAIEFIKSTDLSKLEDGMHIVDGNRVTVKIKLAYETRTEEQVKWECHENHIDIQYLLSGQELMGYCSLSDLQVKGDYIAERDVTYFADKYKGTRIIMKPNTYIILFPQDVHCPQISDGDVRVNNKAVFKVIVSEK